MTRVASQLGALEVDAAESRLGRYVEIRQGQGRVVVEVALLAAFVAAVCEAGGDPLAIEIGDRRIVAPGPLALPPGEYRLLVVAPA